MRKVILIFCAFIIAGLLTVAAASIERHTSVINYEKGWPLTTNKRSTDGIKGPVVYSVSYIENEVLNYLFYLLISLLALGLVSKMANSLRKRRAK
jgi:hypothetical protein